MKLVIIQDSNTVHYVNASLVETVVGMGQTGSETVITFVSGATCVIKKNVKQVVNEFIDQTRERPSPR